MTKSVKLPQKKTQTVNYFTAAAGIKKMMDTDTTSATGTITSTHIFNK